MFISPGEIARGQWLMVHSTVEKEKNFNEQENPLAGLGMLMIAPQAIDQPIPHIVLSVQLPFVAVADCSTTPCGSKVWRTDEKKFVEVKEDFVKALDINLWHRGQKLLDPAYQVPMPAMPTRTPPPKNLGDWPFSKNP